MVTGKPAAANLAANKQASAPVPTIKMVSEDEFMGNETIRMKISY
jgi:hypothetical protein